MPSTLWLGSATSTWHSRRWVAMDGLGGLCGLGGLDGLGRLGGRNAGNEQALEMTIGV